MHIVASLLAARPTRATEGEVAVDVSQQQEERVLCTLKAYADGSFDMRPGFCREGQRYRFMAAGGGVYEYTLTNDADEAPSVVDAKQRLLASSAEARVAALRRQALRRGTIERPAGTGPDAARMLMCAEIVAAKGFRARGVMVEWGLVLDGGPSACKDPEVAAPWTLAASCEATPLSGVTQCSASTKSHEGVPLHHFGHPLEFELECETYPTAKRPTLVLKVSSYDRWDRYRVEGYAYVPVEHTPGMRGTRIVVVDAWRPKGTVEDQLFRFVLGGAPGLKDPRYVEMPEGYIPAEQALSRFGLDTEVGGQLKIRLNTLVHSSRAPRSRAAAKAKAIVDPRTKEERRARATIEAAELDGVIERARTRLERAKLRGDGEPTAAAVLEEFGKVQGRDTRTVARADSCQAERAQGASRACFGRTAPAAVLDTPTEPASRQRVRMLGRQVGPVPRPDRPSRPRSATSPRRRRGEAACASGCAEAAMCARALYARIATRRDGRVKFLEIISQCDRPDSHAKWPRIKKNSLSMRASLRRYVLPSSPRGAAQGLLVVLELLADLPTHTVEGKVQMRPEAPRDVAYQCARDH